MRFPKEVIQPLILINPHVLITSYIGVPSPFRHTYIEFACVPQERKGGIVLVFLPMTPQVCLSHAEADGRMVTEIYQAGQSPLHVSLVPGQLYRCVLPMYGSRLRLKEPPPRPASENMLWFYSHFQVLAPRPDIRRILDAVIESRGDCALTELARQQACSDRHLRRIFTEAMGFGLKEYCRFVRLQEALGEMVQAPGLNVSYYIRNLTYADQSHFQREFREFTGITPRAFLKAYGSKNSAST